MAINYSICFPYCLSLLISVALRRWDATSVSVRMLQRNARVLGLDVPPALLRAGRWGEEPKPPRNPANPRSPRGKGDSVRLFRRDAGLKSSLSAVSRTAEHGSGDSLHLLVSAAG